MRIAKLGSSCLEECKAHYPDPQAHFHGKAETPRCLHMLGQEGKSGLPFSGSPLAPSFCSHWILSVWLTLPSVCTTLGLHPDVKFWPLS